MDVGAVNGKSHGSCLRCGHFRFATAVFPQPHPPTISFSRPGSRELGIPTANLDDASLKSSLGEAVTGIYAGFASIGSSPAVHKTCMSIGFNPVFRNTQKTCEPWILHDFEGDFYGEEIRLVVCAYIRPEADFVSIEVLRWFRGCGGDPEAVIGKVCVSATSLCRSILECLSSVFLSF